MAIFNRDGYTFTTFEIMLGVKAWKIYVNPNVCKQYEMFMKQNVYIDEITERRCIPV